MKKLTLIAMTVLMPVVAMASRPVGIKSVQPSLDIPLQFLTSGETKTLEWGCPISNERISAPSAKAVMEQLTNECGQQIRAAAEAKEGVLAVLQTLVIAPDISISEESKGLHLANGTIFFKTVVSLSRNSR
jgi:hypothetical protein